MDRETAERLTKLEGKMELVEEDRKLWNDLIRTTVIKTVSWLLMVGTAGVIYGWHLPRNIREAITDWIAK